MTPFLTLTGIDAETEPVWVKMMLQDFLYKNGESALEFAILRSPNTDQSPRYPVQDVIDRLIDDNNPFGFAFHLCGRYARMVHRLEWEELCNEIDFSKVGRVQVNSKETDESAIVTLKRFSLEIGKPVIMQWRDNTFPAVDGLHILQDRSAGRGIVETKWSVQNPDCVEGSAIIGYAGGLGPDNVEVALKSINKAANGQRFWIDCESSLRTDDWFDQEKAEKMMSAVKRARSDIIR